MCVHDDYEKTYIDGAGTVQVKTGKSYLHSIIVGTTVATALQVIDNTSGSTTNVAELQASALPGTYLFDCVMTNGIRIVSGAGKYTVVWR